MIYVGGDSVGIDACTFECSTRSDRKVFVTDSEDVIIGFSGSFRTGQLMRYSFTVPEQSAKKDDMAYMVTDFVDAIRSLQKDKGVTSKEHDTGLLVGFNGKLYVIESDFNVTSPLQNYAASGIGSQAALGAMHATAHLNMKPEPRIMLALAAAAEFNASVRAPFYIVKLPDEAK